MHDDHPSSTALLIAKSQVLLADAQPWAVDAARVEIYRACAAEASGGVWECAGLQRFTLKAMERLGVPGIYLHYALRKLAIEARAREFLSAGGARQVVVVAAGFDPLAALLHRDYQDAVFFEADHPATQGPKRRALERVGHGANLRLVEADLEKGSFDKALEGTGFSRELPTLIIAEGITMYLDARQVDRFIRQLRGLCMHPDSVLVFTYMSTSLLGKMQFDTATLLADAWLGLRGEAFKWGMEDGDVAPYLRARQFTLAKLMTAADLSARYMGGRDLKLAKGENICVAKPEL